MKNLFFFALILGMTSFLACSDAEAPMETIVDYHVHINSPNTDNKKQGDSIHVHVDFEDHNGGTVHHVNVQVYERDTKQEIFNGPTGTHVHEVSGKYEMRSGLVLDPTTVAAHSNWILKATVWGHEAGLHETIDSIEFHVHPE